MEKKMIVKIVICYCNANIDCRGLGLSPHCKRSFILQQDESRGSAARGGRAAGVGGAAQPIPAAAVQVGAAGAVAAGAAQPLPAATAHAGTAPVPVSGIIAMIADFSNLSGHDERLGGIRRQ